MDCGCQLVKKNGALWSDMCLLEFDTGYCDVFFLDYWKHSTIENEGIQNDSWRDKKMQIQG